ncbi:MAG: MucR family transcriptional regulator [Micavibrio sp.]|mgnify:CR=1 FL=1|nr:MucR family transcriptional regulator [Micavibrio sp.]|tara:strand:+ start:303 stop:689 length:387 start_codon:yes stop_codon:yes gene_type:complete
MSGNEILTLTTEIVSAHLANNNVNTDDIPALIRKVHETMLQLQHEKEIHGTTLTPSVPVKKSITPDYLICLDDGKQLKMLKRHLKTAYGMTPDDYRTKWNLPADYPMVAPNYAKKRSKLAKEIGLGKR